MLLLLFLSVISIFVWHVHNSTANMTGLHDNVLFLNKVWDVFCINKINRRIFISVSYNLANDVFTDLSDWNKVYYEVYLSIDILEVNVNLALVLNLKIFYVLMCLILVQYFRACIFGIQYV